MIGYPPIHRKIASTGITHTNAQSAPLPTKLTNTSFDATMTFTDPPNKNYFVPFPTIAIAGTPLQILYVSSFLAFNTGLIPQSTPAIILPGTDMSSASNQKLAGFTSYTAASLPSGYIYMNTTDPNTTKRQATVRNGSLA